MPHRHQHELFHGKAGVDQVARVHVDAERAAIDLGDAEIDEIDERLGQAALLEGKVDIAEGLVAVGRNLGVIDTVAHDAFSLIGTPASCVLMV